MIHIYETIKKKLVCTKRDLSPKRYGHTDTKHEIHLPFAYIIENLKESYLRN